MNYHYEDIRDRIPEPPAWFDEHAVPRYGAFTPEKVADIYADEVALVAIKCQGCDVGFMVAFSSNAMQRFDSRSDIAAQIRSGTLHYGDPPNIGCCAAGPSMNSESHCVVEYWHRFHKEHVGPDGIVTNVVKYFEWRRDSSLEVGIEE